MLWLYAQQNTHARSYGSRRNALHRFLYGLGRVFSFARRSADRLLPPRIDFGRFEGHAVLFPGQGKGLNPSEVTIATLLKRAGYATKMVGKWHCGDQRDFLPTRHGFDSYYGLPYSNDMGRQAGRQNQYPPLPLLRDAEVVQQQPEQASLTERYVEECARFIRDHHGQPFFLYLAHMHVHLPIYAPQYFLDRSQNGAYGAAVACIDWSVSVLLHELQRCGIDENTLVVLLRIMARAATMAAATERCAAARHNVGRRLSRAVHCALAQRDPCRQNLQRSDGIHRLLSHFRPLAVWTCHRNARSTATTLRLCCRARQELPARTRLSSTILRTILKRCAAGAGSYTFLKEVSRFTSYMTSSRTRRNRNVIATHAEVVVALEKHLQVCREELGEGRRF
jgi:hypothetical protein